jgi:cytochrome P450 family 6
VLYNLALNEEIQNRLRNEITTILTKYNNELTYEGMQEMKYLQMVIDGQENYMSNIH